MGMISAPLTIIDSPVQLDGETGHAWTWEADEIGCPGFSMANTPAGLDARQSEQDQ